MTNCQIVILAAGKGTRMNSLLPKVLHKVEDNTMLDMVINNAKKVTDDIVLVISDGLMDYASENYPDIKTVIQKNPGGTGHAVFVALEKIDPTKPVAVLFADHPLLTSKIINELIDKLNSTNSSIVTLASEDAKIAGACGRIITDKEGNFVEIVEFKDASDEVKKITLCNSGVTTFKAGVLQEYLTPDWISSKQKDGKETYLTSLIETLNMDGKKIDYMISRDIEHIAGVNTQEELLQAKNFFSTDNTNLVTNDEHTTSLIVGDLDLENC